MVGRRLSSLRRRVRSARATAPVSRPAGGDANRRLLVLDAAYDLDQVRRLGIEESLRARALDGYFSEVWHVHPLLGADRADPHAMPVGPARRCTLEPGHEVVEVPVQRFRILRFAPRLNFALGQALFLLRMVRELRRSPAQAVRSGDPYYLGVLGLILSKLWRRRLFVIRINGNYDEIFSAVGRQAYPQLFPSRKAEKLVERFVLARADLVIAPNQNNLRYARANGAPAERSFVVPYGSLIARCHLVAPGDRRAASGLPTGSLMLYVGRLEPVKHAQDLIDVLAGVVDRSPDVKLVVIGDGSLRQEFLDAAATPALAGRLLVLGAKDQEYIAGAMSRASVIVAPHMGRALVEAALSGTPIVAYDNDWHAEFIEDGLTGTLTPLRDPAAMAEAVLRLLEDPVLAGRLGAAARRRALAEMAPASVAAAERSLYERLFPAGEAARCASCS